jgi:hypothetical protein
LAVATTRATAFFLPVIFLSRRRPARYAFRVARLSLRLALPTADIAQLVEQLIRNQQVISSSLIVGSTTCRGQWPRRIDTSQGMTALLAYARR